MSPHTEGGKTCCATAAANLSATKYATGQEKGECELGRRGESVPVTFYWLGGILGGSVVG